MFIHYFFRTWRAQRGKFFEHIALICHDFSLEILCVDKIRIPPRGILCVETIRSPPRGILCVDKIGSVPQDRATGSRYHFFSRPILAGRPIVSLCPHNCTLARLIIKYPAYQLLGKIQEPRRSTTTLGHCKCFFERPKRSDVS